MNRICIVGGGGYVGLGYAVALAELGRWEELEAELRSEASAWARHPGTAGRDG